MLQETPTPTPGPGSAGEGASAAGGDVGPLDLLLALMGVLAAGGTGYYVVRLNNGRTGLALRLALWCVIGGLALYLTYVLVLPGATWLRARGGAWVAWWVALLGGLVPLSAAWLVRQRRRRA